jgi:hypothetical protein
MNNNGNAHLWNSDMEQMPTQNVIMDKLPKVIAKTAS